MGKLNFRSAAATSYCGSTVFSYIMFAAFPILMFAIILVLKLRGNYLETILHLETSLVKAGSQILDCQTTVTAANYEISMFKSKEDKCRAILGKAAMVLGSVNSAFESELQKSNKSSVTLNIAQSQLVTLRAALLRQQEFDRELQERTAALQNREAELTYKLNNVTADNQRLEEQLGLVKIDLDGLKSNTSRLEGEKEGLEKVLLVKKGIVEEVKEAEEEEKFYFKKKAKAEEEKSEVFGRILKENIEKLVANVGEKKSDAIVRTTFTETSPPVPTTTATTPPATASTTSTTVLITSPATAMQTTAASSTQTTVATAPTTMTASITPAIATTTPTADTNRNPMTVPQPAAASPITPITGQR